MVMIQSRDTPINIRALAAQRALIDKAASLLHKNRSDFMLEAACQEAEKVLLDQRLFLVNDKHYHEYEMLIKAPINKNKMLKNLLRSKAPWDK